MYKLSTALVVVVLMAVVSCSTDKGDAYTENILAERVAKDSAFSIQGESPLEDADIASFHGLPYYPVDKRFRIMARFERNPDPQPFEMPTTTDRRPIYVHFGTAFFQLEGVDLQLNVFQNQELITRPGYENHLFIPFRDFTSGNETYGGGRYIDAEIPEGDSILIDFNLAYHPYCAYNHKYSCPIPPRENSLDVAVEAGEKNKE